MSSNGSKPVVLTYTTVGGIVLEYEPVSSLAMEYSARGIRSRYIKEGKTVDTPTYDVEVAGGAKQTFEMDAETAATKPEWKEQWNKYIVDSQAMNSEIEAVRNEMIFSAVHVELPEDKKWLRTQKRRGIELPEKPTPLTDEKDEDFLDRQDEYFEKLKIHYLQTELLKTVEDFYGIIEAVMTVSMRGALTEEQIEAASAQFRSTKEEARREAGLPG